MKWTIYAYFEQSDASVQEQLLQLEKVTHPGRESFQSRIISQIQSPQIRKSSRFGTSGKLVGTSRPTAILVVDPFVRLMD